MYFKRRLNGNKRGVSPLIATVLLIAFAVSLGAVVINLGVNLFGDPCKERIVEILTVEGNPRACLQAASHLLSMTVVNSGGTSVDGFKLTIVGEVALNEDIPQKMDSLEKKIIAYPVPDITKIDLVTLIPYYSKQGKIKYCSERKVDYAHINNC